MHWVLYLVITASGATGVFHDAPGHVKHFANKAECEKVRAAQIAEAIAPDGFLAGMTEGKDFTLTCKKGKE